MPGTVLESPFLGHPDFFVGTTDSSEKGIRLKFVRRTGLKTWFFQESHD
jgi:hypothetical protein